MLLPGLLPFHSAMGRLSLVSLCVALCLAGRASGRAMENGAENVLSSEVPMPEDAVVPVRCEPSDDASYECRLLTGKENPGTGAGTRGARRLFGRIGFLAGLHLGGAISSTGSLSASHSLNVFGKVMNTALSVSYGPNGLYQGVPPAHGPPLGPVGQPGFGFQDDPSSLADVTTANPNKGFEASALLNLKKTHVSTGDGNVKVIVESHRKESNSTTVVDNPVPGNHTVVDGVSVYHEISSTPHRVKVVVEQPFVGSGEEEDGVNEGTDLKPAPVSEGDDGDDGVIGEEPESDPEVERPVVQLTASRKAEVEGRFRVQPGPAARQTQEQHKLFLQSHNNHVATFNNHLVKYSGDVSRVASLTRSPTRARTST